MNKQLVALWRKIFPKKQQESNAAIDGMNKPPTFADDSKIQQLEDIAVDFFPQILGYDFHGIFVSDQSSLFHFDIEEQELLDRINTIYHLDLRELGDGNIVRILEAIKHRRKIQDQ